MRKKDSIFNPVLSLFNKDYLDIPFSSNMPLPSWCDYKYHNNMIEIFGCIPRGIARSEGKLNYAIRIEDINNVILREFHLVQVNSFDDCSE